jgi:helicase SRCAP
VDDAGNSAAQEEESEEKSLGSTELSETDESEDEEEENEHSDDEDTANKQPLESDLKYLDTSSEQPILPAPAQPTDEIAAKPESDPKEDKVLTNIAATAQSLQPTGYTLETTTVKTQVPVLLLKHTLREYQHVGLDWLVTMNENKLNGILADEMGLGKTIQTIALLAYLACEKGVWGPHLIVVPTSVMLNWELEFKRWAPGFKIMTYYGSPKERKLKRMVSEWWIGIK